MKKPSKETGLLNDIRILFEILVAIGTVGSCVIAGLALGWAYYSPQTVTAIIQVITNGTPNPTVVIATPSLTAIPIVITPPMVTETPISVPPTITPTPDTRLFWDDFEEGIKPEWKMSGSGFAAVNGQLTMDEGSLESTIIGNNNWKNYKILLPGLSFGGGTRNPTDIRVRVQDRDNYLVLRFYHPSGEFISYLKWLKVINGQEEEIPGTRFDFTSHKDFKIEIENNIYRTFKDGEQEVRFTDDSFSNGGVALVSHVKIRLEGIEIIALP